MDQKNIQVLLSVTIISFIDSFQFLSSSLDSSVKKDDFKYLNQEFDNNTLNLVK